MYAKQERVGFVLVALLMLAFLAIAGNVLARPSSAAVYTMSNAPTGNEVLAFERDSEGLLRFSRSLPTGGLGTGGGLGNQGGIVLSEQGHWLLAVNAGSDSISVFDVRNGRLALTDVVSSQGSRPVSVTVSRGLVYVVNADTDNIAGFRLSPRGRLTFLPDSRRSLSGSGTAPAQIGFSPNGRFIVVTEKATNLISVFVLDGFTSDGPVGFPSAGMTPFAFEFVSKEELAVSEAFGGAPGAGAVSLYRLHGPGILDVLAPSVPNFETAPCWLVVSKSGHHVFTSNTPSDSVSAYSARGNSLTLLEARAGEPGMGTRPLDMALSGDGKYLYTLNIGEGNLGVFEVTSSGALHHLGNAGDLPVGVNGLAAR